MVDENAMIAEISRVRRDWSAQQTRDYIATLPFWNCKISLEQHFGGLQNRTYFANTEDGRRYAVRTGFDQARTRQTSVVQCTIAAHTLGLGPRLAYAEPNLTVVEFVAGKGLTLQQMKDPEIIRMIVDRMKILHEGAWAIQETISYWWPFDTVRRYLKWMETGRAATGFIPSRWASRVPELRKITHRLEKVIAPFIPQFTHNDMVFVNMMFDERGDISFIDWDGGAYGHPMWDLAEMLMWAEADEDVTRDAVLYYHGELTPVALAQKLREVRAFQIMAAMRIITESMDAQLDPFYYLTPVEMTQSMKVILPDQETSLEGLIELLIPRYEGLWERYKGEFGG